MTARHEPRLRGVVIKASGLWRRVRFPVESAVGLALGLSWSAPARGESGLLVNVGDYTIENWQVEQGLPQISVTAIAQTPDGYLWLGTFNGLARFDGVRFTVLGEADAPALGCSSISRLVTDRQGGLWILTHEGRLLRYADGRFTAYGPDRGLPPTGAAALVLDLDEHLLLVDRNGGLRQVAAERLTVSCHAEGGAGAEPRLLVAPSEPCWVEKQGQAVNSTGVPVRLPTTGEGISPEVEITVRCAARSHTGGFWLAGTSGVYRFQHGVVQGPPVAFPQPPRDLVAMAEDRRGNLWIGTWSDGLLHRDPAGRWQQFRRDTGLPENDVASIFVDREDNVWVGTGRGGLLRFKPRLFRTYDQRDGLTGTTVTAVAEDRQGRIWLGLNGGGVNCWQDGRFWPVTEPVEVGRYPLVYSLLADGEDGIWIGIYGGRLLRLHAGIVTTYLLAGDLLDATPRALYQDREGTIWLGGDRGLQSYGGGRFTSHRRPGGLAYAEVRALAQDRNGTLFIGMRGGGLSCVRSNEFRHYAERDGLPDDHVAALCVDHQDTLWVGTLHRGLSRLRQGRFATVTTHDGLPSNGIGMLLEDDSGHLWLGSNRGIARLDLEELNGYLDGRGQVLTCRVFSRSDGLGGIDCSGGGQPACGKARDGRLWFATVKGVAVVDPRQLPVNPLPPPVVIEEVAVGDVAMCLNPRRETRRHPPAEAGFDELEANAARSARWWHPSSTAGSTLPTLVVAPGEHRLEFRFTALSLVAPENVRFRYRLKRLDADWREVGTQRTASFQRVPPGEYRFEVTACNSDGIWNETGAVLGVVIEPAAWQTWWFQSLAVIGMVGVACWVVEARWRHLKRERAAHEAFSRRLLDSQEEERKRIAGELHDSLGQDLLVIKNRALLGLQGPPDPTRAAEQLDAISRLASHTLEEVREISHNLRPYQLDRLGLTQALRAMITSVSGASGLSIAAELAPLDRLLPPAMEIHLYRVVQELLNNLVKHARAATTRVAIRHRAQKLTIVFEDDGCGFDPDRLARVPAGPGFGLTDIAERVRLLGGTARCESRPAAGTRWLIEIPLTSAADP